MENNISHWNLCTAHPHTAEVSFHYNPIKSDVTSDTVNIYYGDLRIQLNQLPCDDPIWEILVGDHSAFILFSLRAFLLSCRVFSSVIVEKVLYTQSATIIMVFNKRGME